jgi:hypothetical protein
MKRQEWTLSPELAAFVDSFSRLALDLPGRMAAVCVEIEEIEARLRELTAQGLIRAIPDWRTSKRKRGEHLTLVFPADAAGKRPRKYIGRDPAKVQEALDALARAEEYDRLTEKLCSLMAGSVAASCHLSNANRSLTCRGG